MHEYKITIPKDRVSWLYITGPYVTYIGGWDEVRHITRQNAANLLRVARERGYTVERER
jgi:hypothetical protein